MNLLQQGFREIGRKFKRFSLGRQIAAARRTRQTALRTLGRRAAETGTTGAASDDLKARLADKQSRDAQLQSQLGGVDDQIKHVEQQRDADAARLSAREQEVIAQKTPLEAELSSQQSALSRSQQQIDDARRRVGRGDQERQSLEAALGKPASQDPAGFDRAQAAARIAAIAAERQQLDASQGPLAEAGAAATREIERLKAASAPHQAELARVRTERTTSSDAAKKALADLRSQRDKLRGESAALANQRNVDFEELAGAVMTAGAAEPALAAEHQAVEAAQQSEAALQSQLNHSLAESQSLPSGTMPKFTGLLAAGVLGVAAAGYAASMAMQEGTPAEQPAAAPAPAPKPTPAASGDCRMTYDTNKKKPPVQADAGGPYEAVRGAIVTLDGSRSKGSCLTYVWTFDPAPPSGNHGPSGGARAGGSGQASDDDAVFAAVNQIACPDGTNGNPGARKTGAVAPTVFLCTLKAVLTVTDGNSTDSKSVLVSVKPRGPWQTSVDQTQTETYNAGSKLIRALPNEAQPDLLLGTNVCAIDNNAGHALHAGSSWLGEGYAITAVKDPNGPFDGWWYVSASTLKIKRSAQLNQDLSPTSAVYQTNLARGYSDMDTLRRAVLEHEKLHGTLIFEKMQKIQRDGHDPAKLIEPLSVPAEAKDSLVQWADIAIRQIESHLYPGQGSQEYIANHVEIKSRLSKNPQFNRGGKILLPDSTGAYGQYPIANFATAGENGG